MKYRIEIWWGSTLVQILWWIFIRWIWQLGWWRLPLKSLLVAVVLNWFHLRTVVSFSCSCWSMTYTVFNERRDHFLWIEPNMNWIYIEIKFAWWRHENIHLIILMLNTYFFTKKKYFGQNSDVIQVYWRLFGADLHD